MNVIQKVSSLVDEAIQTRIKYSEWRNLLGAAILEGLCGNFSRMFGFTYLPVIAVGFSALSASSEKSNVLLISNMFIDDRYFTLCPSEDIELRVGN